MAEPVPTAEPTRRRRVLRLLSPVAIVYFGVLLVLMIFENRLVYHPAPADVSWQPAPSPEIEDVWLTSADGTTIHAWFCPEPTSDGAVLYLHGNAGNLSHRGNSIVMLSKVLKTSVLIIDYPGYGKSGGRPTEAGCYQAADAAYAWLTSEREIPGERILLFGGSLGGAVAVDLASRADHRALILVKTFSSAPDVGAAFFPWLPVRWVMRNRFNSLAKIQKVQRPVFMAHGPRDTVVPYALGKRLFKAANAPKTFFVLDGQDHNDRLGHDFFEALLPFLREHP